MREWQDKGDLVERLAQARREARDTTPHKSGGTDSIEAAMFVAMAFVYNDWVAEKQDAAAKAAAETSDEPSADVAADAAPAAEPVTEEIPSDDAEPHEDDDHSETETRRPRGRRGRHQEND